GFWWLLGYKRSLIPFKTVVMFSPPLYFNFTKFAGAKTRFYRLFSKKKQSHGCFGRHSSHD
ncbi:hypothetical protein, partial [Limosilactobacillus reuteri]|uniref:hypothetical protein n=1 Tax=Limosilactobacillus reuteri TaxID=1598 RepID=UPI002B0028E3